MVSGRASTWARSWEHGSLLCLFALGDRCLPVGEIAEPHNLVDTQVLQEHRQNGKPLALTGKDAAHKLDLLRGLIKASPHFLIRPATPLPADVPISRAHGVPP